MLAAKIAAANVKAYAEELEAECGRKDGEIALLKSRMRK